MKTIFFAFFFLATTAQAKTLVAVCETKEQKEKAELYVDSKGLGQLFTGVKSVSGDVIFTDKELILPATFKKTKDAHVNHPLVQVNSNLVGSTLNFIINLRNSVQEVYVTQIYGDQNYDFEMDCVLE